MRFVGNPLLLHALGLACIGIAVLFLDSPAEQMRVSGAIACAYYLMIGVLESRTSFLKITPLSFYFFWQSIGQGLSAIYMASTLAVESSLELSGNIISANDSVTGYLYCLVGSFCMHAGFYLRGIPKSLTETRRESPSWFAIAPLWIVGVVVTLLPKYFVALGSIAGLLNWAAFTALCLIGLGIRHAPRTRQPFLWFWLLVGTLVLPLVNIRTGSKFYIMLAVFPLLWTLLLHKDTRKYISLVGVIILTIYFGVVAPVVGISRLLEEKVGETVGDRIFRAYVEEFQGQIPFRDVEYVGTQLGGFLFRQFESLPVGFFAGDVRENGFQKGATLDYVGYALIPRVIWPDKPSVTRGAWFTAYLGFAHAESEATMSTGMTAVGELFWNFGLAGIVVGMGLIGYCKGSLWNMAGADPRGNPLTMYLYVLVTFEMANMPEAGTVVVTMLIEYLVFRTVMLISGQAQILRSSDAKQLA